MKFEVVDVSGWPAVGQESGGAEPKDWLVRPDDVRRVGRGHWWLYKEVKRGPTSNYRRHDDVAERLASALARIIQLPAADVELARRGDGEGIISRNVAPDDWEMHSGDTVLSVRPGYVSCFGEGGRRNRVGHNLTNIAAVLHGSMPLS
ncbi:MAG TPA: hypothetical protein VFX70_11665 [Mycobacteriales bacterium]|nr:hypothetical protein [Mycobacteriales bacterium]